jgi:hypothetical protein
VESTASGKFPRPDAGESDVARHKKPFFGWKKINRLTQIAGVKMTPSVTVSQSRFWLRHGNPIPAVIATMRMSRDQASVQFPVWLDFKLQRCDTSHRILARSCFNTKLCDPKFDGT